MAFVTSSLEREKNTNYSRSTGNKICSANNETTYYYCNRTGKYKPRTRNTRHLKSQGTSKLDKHCTSSIIALKCLRTGRIQAKICHTHYGHKTEVGHLRLSKTDRMQIAGQLAHGVKSDFILNNIRDGLQDTISRVHLTTRKDITNIQTAYGLNAIEKHRNDVHLWVEELKREDFNPVLLYKPQGDPQPIHWLG
jgi:hypothetical protein